MKGKADSPGEDSLKGGMKTAGIIIFIIIILLLVLLYLETLGIKSLSYIMQF